MCLQKLYSQERRVGLGSKPKIILGLVVGWRKDVIEQSWMRHSFYVYCFLFVFPIVSASLSEAHLVRIFRRLLF